MIEKITMRLVIEKKDECTLIRLADPTLGVGNHTEFKTEITRLVNSGSKKLILDFEQVAMVDSSGLGALISVIKTVGKDGKLALMGVNPKVRNVFKMTHLDKLFSLYENEEDAERALS